MSISSKLTLGPLSIGAYNRSGDATHSLHPRIRNIAFLLSMALVAVLSVPATHAHAAGPVDDTTRARAAETLYWLRQGYSMTYVADICDEAAVATEIRAAYRRLVEDCPFPQ